VRAGEGHEGGRQPLLVAQELRVRAGRRGLRVPLRGAARGHHRGRDRRSQAREELRRQRTRRVRRPPGPLLVRQHEYIVKISYGPSAIEERTELLTMSMDEWIQGELRCGRDPAGNRGEHEPRAALRPRVDGRGLLRGQERRVRRRGRSGRRHGAHHPRPHLRHRAVVVFNDRHADGVCDTHRCTGREHNDPSRRGTTWRAIEAMMQAATGGEDQPETAGEGHRSCRSAKGRAAWGHLGGLAGQKKPARSRDGRTDGPVRGGRLIYYR
jgi:hypothetical protein